MNLQVERQGRIDACPFLEAKFLQQQYVSYRQPNKSEGNWEELVNLQGKIVNYLTITGCKLIHTILTQRDIE